MEERKEGESDSLTPQNSQFWPEQLRAEQVSFLLLLLLCAPVSASHGDTCDTHGTAGSSLLQTTVSTRAPSAGPRGTRRAGTCWLSQEHTTTLLVCIIKGQISVDTFVFDTFSQGKRPLCSHCMTQAGLYVCKKGHCSSQANVDKRLIVKGGMSNPITQLLGC